MKVRILAIVVTLIFLAGCAQATSSSNPAWVDKLIQRFEADAVTNPPLSI